MAAGFKRTHANHEALARMVAKGFEDVSSRMATKDDLAKVKLELKQEIQGLRNSVNNYLRLSTGDIWN